ncbi:hypothetical protein [Caudoviricetes sp.]|nr:hypothetical protein [Caudoviricetes sp.]
MTLDEMCNLLWLRWGHFSDLSFGLTVDTFTLNLGS